MKKLAINIGLKESCSGKQLINTTYINAGRWLDSLKTFCLLITSVRKKACNTIRTTELIISSSLSFLMLCRIYRNNGKAFSVLVISGLGRIKTHITSNTSGNINKLTKRAERKKFINTTYRALAFQNFINFAANLLESWIRLYMLCETFLNLHSDSCLQLVQHSI